MYAGRKRSYLSCYPEATENEIDTIYIYIYINLGQDPIKALLYKRVGEEYLPHSNGTFQGGKYRIGDRVATSIVYCNVPIMGLVGKTSFTRSGLMIKTCRGDILLFTYKFPSGTVDNRFTEQLGCTIWWGGEFDEVVNSYAVV